MTVEAFRIENFMGFEDSGWLELRPITLLFGRNSSGKSAILRALLLLWQSRGRSTAGGPLVFDLDDAFDLGGFDELVRDHKLKAPMYFWFRCRFTEDWRDRAGQALAKFGASGPCVRARFKYQYDAATRSNRLSGLVLYDEDRRILLRAIEQTAAEPGEPAWFYESDFFDPYREMPDIWPYAEVLADRGFAPILYLPASGREEADRYVELAEVSKNFGERYYWCWQILEEIRSAIDGFLRDLEYLGPLRRAPQRDYGVAGQKAGLADEGLHFVRDLVRGGPTLLKRVNDWLVSAKLNVCLDLVSANRKKTRYELCVVEVHPDGRRGLSANIREVGFGMSQILPVVVQTLTVPPGSMLLIEQPELHLHPAAQAALGDLFILAAQEQKRLVIETHSEHLVLRLQRRIRERLLDAQDLTVLYVTRSPAGSICHSLRIDSEGDFIDHWPEGFFDERLDELFASSSDQFLLDGDGEGMTESAF